MKMQPQNGFLIQAFYGDMRDKELLRLTPFLAFLANLDDVRPVREWAKKFRKEPKLKYVDREGTELILNRPKFIDCLVRNLIDREVKKLKIVSKTRSTTSGSDRRSKKQKFENILDSKQHTSLHAKLLDTDSDEDSKDDDLEEAYEYDPKLTSAHSSTRSSTLKWMQLWAALTKSLPCPSVVSVSIFRMAVRLPETIISC